MSPSGRNSALSHLGNQQGLRARFSERQRMSRGDPLIGFDTDMIGEKPDPVDPVANNDCLGMANLF